MKTVNEVSKLTGVSIRALHHYDKIGLLHPTKVTESGYRLYDDTALERLQQILLFRELEFSLKAIQEILDSPNFDRDGALEQQITLLSLKKERLDNLIGFARDIRATGGKTMNFDAFDTKKIDEYTEAAKKRWGDTSAYKDFELKNKGRNKTDMQIISKKLMAHFEELGKLRNTDPSSEAAQAQIRLLQQFITENFYNCTPEILSGLGKMYAAGGEFTENIDSAGGAGTAAFAEKAIEYYCKK